MKIKKVAIVGMGALGLMYGTHITEHADDETVEFVMDANRVKKYAGAQFTCNEKPVKFQLTDAAEATPADLLVVAVKYTGLKGALETMKNSIGPNTVIVSVMNGVTSEKIIGERFPEYSHNIVPALAQGLDAMKFGNALHYTRMGEVHCGMVKETNPEAFAALTEFFDRIKLPYAAEEDIMYRMWCKFMQNVGINQTTMVYGATYHDTLVPGEPNRTLIGAMREVRVLANAEGINITEKDLNYYVDLLATLDPKGTPSMGQDRINKRPSEVEMFAGAVIEMAKKHDLRVPVNEFLYKRVHEIEKEYT